MTSSPLHPDTQSLLQAWQQCPGHETEAIHPTESFKTIVNRLITRDDWADRASEAAEHTSDAGAFFRMLQDVATQWVIMTPEGPVEAHLWFLPVTGAVDPMRSWQKRPQHRQILQDTVANWIQAWSGQSPISVEPLDRWIAPAKIAEADPFLLRQVALALLCDQPSASTSELMGTLSTDVAFQQDAPTSAIWFTQRLIPVVVLLQPKAAAMAEGQDLDGLWARLCLPLTTGPQLAVEAPVTLREALGGTLSSQMALHWYIQRLHESETMGQTANVSDSLDGYLKHITLTKTEEGIVMGATGPYGLLAPLTLPTAWAFCKGPSFLQRLVRCLSRKVGPEMTSISPAGSRKLH